MTRNRPRSRTLYDSIRATSPLTKLDGILSPHVKVFKENGVSNGTKGGNYALLIPGRNVV